MSPWKPLLQPMTKLASLRLSVVSLKYIITLWVMYMFAFCCVTLCSIPHGYPSGYRHWHWGIAPVKKPWWIWVNKQTHESTEKNWYDHYKATKVYSMGHTVKGTVVEQYRQVSNIRRTSVGNKIVDHSDVVGASPVGAAPTTFSFST